MFLRIGGIKCFDDLEKRLHVVNFSGGKDSTYMLLEMIRRNMPIDIVLNVDTGMEFPAMYNHIGKVEQFLLSERGISITRLKNPQSFEELMFDAVKAETPEGASGYGWPGAVVRWCTGQLKIHLIDAYTKKLPTKPLHYIALAADEQYRLKRKANQNPSKRYPLVNWNITEKQALAGCYEAGYTWDGLYEQFSRVSCWCCPLQSLDELRALWQYHPKLWAELRRLDDHAVAQFGRDNAYGRFRPKESVRMLEVRFDFEREWWPLYGKSKTKAFFTSLNRRYQERAAYIGFTVSDPHFHQDRVAELLPYVTGDDLPEMIVEDIPAAWKKRPAQKAKRQSNPTR